jgi:AcrR family transcriptional regulator
MARPRSDIAPRIVHAARRRFLVEGVDGASLRAIAHDARTSIGMIYYYFPTKDDLFLAVVEEVYVALLEDLESTLARTRAVVDRVRALYQRLGTLTAHESDIVRLVLREALASPARLDRLIARFRRGHIPLLVDLVRDGVAAGVFRNDLPAGVLIAAVGTLGGPAQILLGVLGAHLPAKMVPRADTRAPALVDVLLDGIRVRSPRPATLRSPRPAKRGEG